MDYLPRLVEVTVVDGAGSVLMPYQGTIFSIGVIPPTSGAQYDISGFDSDGFLLYFGDDVVGKINMAVKAQIFGKHTVTISEASADGSYKVKMWYDQ